MTDEPRQRVRKPRKAPEPPPIPEESPGGGYMPEPIEPEIPQCLEREPHVSAFKLEQAQKLAAELARRQIESLRLYEPLATVQEFHRSPVREKILRGSNRAGKTVGAAVEVARAATGQDPFGKYPKENGRAYFVGKDGKHLGEVMYRKLFRAGAIQIIRDEVTGRWRAFRPWHPADASRRKQTKAAPPLIPARWIKEIAWENKRENQPSIVRLKNGWELLFFSSLGKPPQGGDIDLAWFDEEIVDASWYPEISARLVDRSGHFLWSATPQAGTEQLYNLHERAESDEGREKPGIVEFVVLLDDNPHLTTQQKEEFAQKLTSDEERRIRIGGEFALVSSKVYAEFSMVTHGVAPFEIPLGWTRYMVVDPGRQICAVLFAAVPPEPEGDYVYLYDELYLRNCTAEIFAEAVYHKASGQAFQAFVIDHHGGRVTEAGSGRTVEIQYSEALAEQRIESVATGSNFVWGSDDIQGGILAAKSWMRIRQDGTTKLRVFRDRLLNLVYEINRYRNKVERGVVTDQPNQRNNHLMDGLRYLASYNPKFIKPPAPKKPVSDAVKAVRKKEERRRQKEGRRYVNLGPGKGGPKK